MPPFAAKWFALTSQEREQLRNLRNQDSFKAHPEIKDEKWSTYPGYQPSAPPQMYPWQPWAYYGMQPPAGPDYGQQRFAYGQNMLSKPQ